MKKFAMIILVVLIALTIGSTALQSKNPVVSQKNALYFEIINTGVENIVIDYNYMDSETLIPKRTIALDSNQNQNLITSILMYIGDAERLDSLEEYGDYSPTTEATHLIEVVCTNNVTFQFYYNYDLDLLTYLSESISEEETPVVTLTNYQVDTNFKKVFDIYTEPSPIPTQAPVL